MKDEVRVKVEKYGEELLRVFPEAKVKDPAGLCRRLRRLGMRAYRAAEDACNTTEGYARWELEKEQVLEKLDGLLEWRKSGVPVFVNGDPRGYALKIQDWWMRDHWADVIMLTDWGGYGILAPDLS